MECIHCGKTFRGRTDKKYCSKSCYNAHYRLRKEPHLDIIKQVDAILHRNHSILSHLPWKEQNRLVLPEVELKTRGFHFDFHTGLFTNRHGHHFFYVYNFAWSPLPNKMIWILKK
ncbi:MAG: hypothetical protein H6563_01045 [Lewinellaceae bacterium]|nr:hypothetical protein [Lewinellaceae bacterium]